MGGSRLLFRTHEHVIIHLEIAWILLREERVFVLHYWPVFAFLVDETTI